MRVRSRPPTWLRNGNADLKPGAGSGFPVSGRGVWFSLRLAVAEPQVPLHLRLTGDGGPDGPAIWGAFFFGLVNQADAIHHPPPTAQQAPRAAPGSSAPTCVPGSSYGGGGFGGPGSPSAADVPSQALRLTVQQSMLGLGSLAGWRLAQGGAGVERLRLWCRGTRGGGAPTNLCTCRAAALGSSLPRSARLANVT